MATLSSSRRNAPPLELDRGECVSEGRDATYVCHKLAARLGGGGISYVLCGGLKLFNGSGAWRSL